MTENEVHQMVILSGPHHNCEEEGVFKALGRVSSINLQNTSRLRINMDEPSPRFRRNIQPVQFSDVVDSFGRISACSVDVIPDYHTA